MANENMLTAYNVKTKEKNVVVLIGNTKNKINKYE